MALDEALLLKAPELGRPVLRFYGWTTPAATFGYFQRIAQVREWTPLRPLIRRPTGGGLVPHDADWTYSLVYPCQHPRCAVRARESYCEVHQMLRKAFAKVSVASDLAEDARSGFPGQCFAGAEQHDVLCNGRKIAGAAQRRTRTGLLVQGSVQAVGLPVKRSAWERALLEVIQAETGARFEPLKPSGALEETARGLERAKYSQPSYNEMR